jgi:hypothetical protein
MKSYSQITFENGYFINESNQRVECLIRNIDWKNNPIEFEYKLNQNASIQKADVQTVKEFSINGASKYLKAKVKIDRSSDYIKGMSEKKNPIFNEEKLFLKVLIEGKASLLIYEDNIITRYFYKKDDSEVKQLVYKSYLYKHSIAKNMFFRQQLYLNFKCQDISMNDVKYIKYKKNALKKFITRYNKCNNSKSIDYEPKQKRDLFNLSFRPGFNSSNLKLGHLDNRLFCSDFGHKINFRFGIEAEFILPFNKNKWSIIIEPTYQSCKSEKSWKANYIVGGNVVSKVNYQSIELPIGIRHYFHLNNSSKIFTNISYIIDFNKKTSLESLRADGSTINEVELMSRNNAAFGIGYKYLDRYSLEMRYQTERNILGDYLLVNSSYKTFSIIFGYSIF